MEENKVVPKGEEEVVEPEVVPETPEEADEVAE